jgi:hypothetical protein
LETKVSEALLLCLSLLGSLKKSVLAPFWLHLVLLAPRSACLDIFSVALEFKIATWEDPAMATVYGIHKEQRASGIRYRVDYSDESGRRSKRRFKRARDAEAFKKQVEASTYTGLAVPRPVAVTFGDWAGDETAKYRGDPLRRGSRRATLLAWNLHTRH